MKRLLLPLLAAYVLPNAVNAGVDPEVRKACLKAVDFQGCVRAYTEPKSSSEKLDFLGKPIIPGWRAWEDRPKNIIFYFNDRDPKKVKVRGLYGRYVGYEYVVRWYQDPKSGTPGYSSTIGSSTTNCYGSASGYGMTCTTNPPFRINIPGRPAIEGGVRQKKIFLVLDCLEKTMKRAEGVIDKKWTPIAGTYPYAIPISKCSSISTLRPSNFTKFEKGKPTEKDKKALVILPRGGNWIPHPIAGKNEIYDGTMWQPPNWELIHVLAGSSAETSGLLVGDKLIKINGYNPNKFAWPALSGEQYKQGTFNTYEIKRGTEVLKIRTKNNDYFVPQSSKIFY